MRTALHALVLSLALASFTTPASAQCPGWDTRFAPVGTDATVYALTVFDDGTGPALYAGGDFYAAGSAVANHIARWNGTSWAPLGDGIVDYTSHVYALASFDDGSGPALYVAGIFTQVGGSITAQSIARWNGSTWSACGTFSPRVLTLAVYDDGTGPALYAGGDFLGADGAQINHVAKWNGSTWTSVGGGVTGPSLATGVFALCAFDDGTGPALYAGGFFDTAGGVSASNVAKWNGATWAPVANVGSITSFNVSALAVFDDGSGPALFAGGTFPSIGGTSANNVAKWNGTAWTALGSGTNGGISAFGSWDDGSGPALYVGGAFTSAGGVSAKCMAKWNGSTWSALGNGMSGVATPVIRAIAAFDSGSGPTLYAAGRFETAGTGGATCISRWNGSTWSGLNAGLGLSNESVALATYDDGSGTALYVGGRFLSAGTTVVNRIAKMQGSSWASVGQGTDGDVLALAVFDSGFGPELYAAGTFTAAGDTSAHNIARWNGSSWSALADGTGFQGTNSTVNALSVFDDGSGPALYVGGIFSTAGGVSASRIAKWDGAHWHALGNGLDNTVRALIAFDDGSGTKLYVGGDFTSSGGNPLSFIARWDGASWSSSGSGWSGPVLCFGVFQSGASPVLYAGTAASSGKLIYWTGSAWTFVPLGPNAPVSGLQAFNDGTGWQLYVYGEVTVVAGFNQVNHLARWNGLQWDSVLGGLSGVTPFIDNYNHLLAFDDGADGAADLYVTGLFSRGVTAQSGPSLPTVNFAEYHGCPAPGVPYCAGDGTLTTACPCANVGHPGHGCNNSTSTGGALLSTTGSPNPDSVVLVSDNELPSALSIFLQGDASLSTAAVFGDGVRCVGGHLKRLYAVNASNGHVAAPSPFDPKIHERSAALGDPIAPGSTRYYQVYYRDPNLAFCASPPGDAFNVSSGVSILW
jgi:hypothetical protein